MEVKVINPALNTERGTPQHILHSALYTTERDLATNRANCLNHLMSAAAAAAAARDKEEKIRQLRAALHATIWDLGAVLDTAYLMPNFAPFDHPILDDLRSYER